MSCSFFLLFFFIDFSEVSVSEVVKIINFLLFMAIYFLVVSLILLNYFRNQCKLLKIKKNCKVVVIINEHLLLFFKSIFLNLANFTIKQKQLIIR